jgi:hypothetical protein
MIARALALILVVLAVSTSGCALFGRKKTPPQIFTAPAPKPPQEPAPLPPPPPVASPGPAELPSVPAPPVSSPSKPPPPRKASSPQRAPSPPIPAAEPEAAPQPAQPQPQLTQLLSPRERQLYNQAIDEALRSVQRNLSLLAGKKLTGEQSVNLERVHAFVRQARQSRAADLVTARSLAQRADLLARDLVTSLR